MVLENDVGVGLHIEASFEDSADLGRGINCKFSCFLDEPYYKLTLASISATEICKSASKKFK